jgi:hypothetical protein
MFRKYEQQAYSTVLKAPGKGTVLYDAVPSIKLDRLPLQIYTNPLPQLATQFCNNQKHRLILQQIVSQCKFLWCVDTKHVWR